MADNRKAALDVLSQELSQNAVRLFKDATNPRQWYSSSSMKKMMKSLVKDQRKERNAWTKVPQGVTASSDLVLPSVSTDQPAFFMTRMPETARFADAADTPRSNTKTIKSYSAAEGHYVVADDPTPRERKTTSQPAKTLTQDQKRSQKLKNSSKTGDQNAENIRFPNVIHMDSKHTRDIANQGKVKTRYAQEAMSYLDHQMRHHKNKTDLIQALGDMKGTSPTRNDVSPKLTVYDSTFQDSPMRAKYDKLRLPVHESEEEQIKSFHDAYTLRQKSDLHLKLKHIEHDLAKKSHKLKRKGETSKYFRANTMMGSKTNSMNDLSHQDKFKTRLQPSYSVDIKERDFTKFGLGKVSGEPTESIPSLSVPSISASQAGRYIYRPANPNKHLNSGDNKKAVINIALPYKSPGPQTKPLPAIQPSDRGVEQTKKQEEPSQHYLADIQKVRLEPVVESPRDEGLGKTTTTTIEHTAAHIFAREDEIEGKADLFSRMELAPARGDYAESVSEDSGNADSFDRNMEGQLQDIIPPPKQSQSQYKIIQVFSEKPKRPRRSHTFSNEPPSKSTLARPNHFTGYHLEIKRRFGGSKDNTKKTSQKLTPGKSKENIMTEETLTSKQLKVPAPTPI